LPFQIVYNEIGHISKVNALIGIKLTYDSKIESLIPKNSTSKSTSTTSSSPFKVKRDPNLAGSYGEKSTDFKNSQTNAPKN